MTGRELEAIIADSGRPTSQLLKAQPRPGSDNSVFVVLYNGLTQAKGSVKRAMQRGHFPFIFPWVFCLWVRLERP